MGLVPMFSISPRTLAYANPVLLADWVTQALDPMHTTVALAACIAIFAVSAWGQSPTPGLINVGVGSDTPTVQIPTKTNPNAQLTGRVTSVSGGNPTAVGPIKTTVNVPSTTTTTGGTFNVLGSGVPATTTTTGGTFNVIGSGGGASTGTTTTVGGVTTVTSAAVGRRSPLSSWRACNWVDPCVHVRVLSQSICIPYSNGSKSNMTGVYAGDPEIRAFDGNTFEFEGNPGSFYEALADDSHQVSVHLKVGVMWDHNGTYMQGVGMKAHDQAVIVTLDDDDSLQGEGLSALLGSGRYFLMSTMRCMGFLQNQTLHQRQYLIRPLVCVQSRRTMRCCKCPTMALTALTKRLVRPTPRCTWTGSCSVTSWATQS